MRKIAGDLPNESCQGSLKRWVILIFLQLFKVFKIYL